jgi:hypothetical protein
MSPRALAAIACFVLVPTALATPCQDYRAYLHWTGGIATAGDARAIAIAGDFAYVADATAGLTVLDIADPQAPALLATLPLPAAALSLDVAGDLAVIAAGEAGVFVVDVSTPTAPALLGGVATPPEAKDVVIDGIYAHVAAGLAGMYVVSLANPSSPEVVGQTGVAWGDAAGIAVWGDRAYVANGAWGVFVVDISDPATPLVVDDVHLGGIADDVAVTATGLFIAATYGAGPTPMDLYPHTMLIGIDRASLTDPVLGNEIYIGRESPGRLAVVGDVVYGTNGPVGLYCVDGSAPTAPVLLGSAAVRGTAAGVAVAGDVAWVAAGDAGLQRVDVSMPASPPLWSSFYPNDGTGGNTGVDAVAYGNGLAYIAYSVYGFTYYEYGQLGIIDLSDPAAPTSLFEGLYFIPNEDGQFVAFDIALKDNVLLLSIDSGSGYGSNLRVIDVTDPTDPQDLGLLSDIFSRDVFVFGRYGYAIEADAYLRVLDLLDPAAPVLVASLDVGGGVAVVQYSGGLCVMQPDGHLVILDISDPVMPVLVATVAIPGGSPVDGARLPLDRFAVADANLGLLIYDATSPASPTLLGSLALPGVPRRIGGANIVAAVACGTGGVQLVDIGDVTDPVPAGSIPGFAYGVSDPYFAYLVGLDHVLAVAPTDCLNLAAVDVAAPELPMSGLRLQASPNPFNPCTMVSFTLDRAQRVWLAIYDLAGRKVIDLAARTFGPGDHTITWDGRDASGRDVPSGSYLLQLEAAQGRQTHKVTLVR